MFILSLNLFIIYGSSILTGWTFEAIIPYVLHKIEYYREVAAAGEMLSRPEKEHILDNYNTIQENVYNYIQITILFGYTAMFISALPLAATLAYISQLFEIQFDSWKLLEVYRRPESHGASEIGTW
jgi:Calcium-activated chloride channel